MTKYSDADKETSWFKLRICAEPPQFSDFDVPEQAIKSFSIAMGAYIIQGAHGMWLEPESDDGHCNPGKLVVTLGSRMSEFATAYNGSVIGSPIEGMLLGALAWLELDWAGFPSVWDLNFEDVQADNWQSEKLRYIIIPQAEVAGYKVDFMLCICMGKHLGGIAIECDGHDFHEKTKEQAARDKRRDREILSAGYPVMRFTGSEIYKDAVACVEQIRGPATDLLLRISKAGGLFVP